MAGGPDPSADPGEALTALLAAHLLPAAEPAGVATERVTVRVALSGGLDSGVLLHVAARLAAREPRLLLRAVHVDHGLQAAAQALRERSEALAQACGVPLEIVTVAIRADGRGLEAAARAERYAALAALLEPGELLLTAHHEDDQAETLLLQLLRGAGVAGLAAMPARARLGAGCHLRPWLGVPRSLLRAYAAAVNLAWHEDPMNDDLRHERVFVRRELLPLLRTRWPAATRTLARSAAHLGEAHELLEADAARTLATLSRDGTLDATGLRALTPAARAQVLRSWIRRQGVRAPSTRRLAALDDLLASAPAAQPQVDLEGGTVRRYRDRLYFTQPLPAVPAAMALTVAQPLDLGGSLGRLRLEVCRGGGLAAERLGAMLSVRWRAGGEQLREHPAGPHRELRKLCQEQGILPWMRGYLPLLYHGVSLVAVGDLWVDADWRAAPGDAGWRVVWELRPRLQ